MDFLQRSLVDLSTLTRCDHGQMTAKQNLMVKEMAREIKTLYPKNNNCLHKLLNLPCTIYRGYLIFYVEKQNKLPGHLVCFPFLNMLTCNNPS